MEIDIAPMELKGAAIRIRGDERDVFPRPMFVDAKAIVVDASGLEIPWPEGMTFSEALLAWKRSPA